MNKRYGPVNISTFLSMILSTVFVMVAALAVALVHYNMHQHALTEAQAKMRMMLDRNMAIHTYFSQILKPNLFEWTEPFRSADYFDPSWMSSSYAVREMGKYFEEFSTVDYYFKDATINARNPENEADAEERAYIEELKTNPSLKERSSVRTIDGEPYLVVLSPGEVMEESCLRCHGNPEDAPGDLVRLYGAERSFHREAELGNIISAVSVRVPLATAYAEADHVSLQFSAFLLMILGLFFLAQIWLSRRLIFAPLTILHDKALLISTHEEHLGEQIPVPFGRELGALTRAFNTMSIKLRESWEHLEARVQERTADLKQSQETLRHERDFAEILIETAQTIVLVLDTQGCIVRINPYMEEISGYTLAEVQGKDWFTTFLPERDREQIRRIFLNAMSDIPMLDNVKLIMTKDGPEREIEWNVKTLRDVQGNVAGLIAIGQDVTERKQADEVLKRLSIHDALTGLYNRHFFVAEMERLERGRQFPVSILVADVDHLKITNDHYGHDAGDALLKRVAQALTAAFRAEDVVARIGGDEFAVLLPATNASAAETSLQRVRQAIQKNNAAHTGTPISLSLGVSTAENPAPLSGVLQEADANMYREKRGNNAS